MNWPFFNLVHFEEFFQKKSGHPKFVGDGTEYANRSDNFEFPRFLYLDSLLEVTLFCTSWWQRGNLKAFFFYLSSLPILLRRRSCREFKFWLAVRKCPPTMCTKVGHCDAFGTQVGQNPQTRNIGYGTPRRVINAVKTRWKAWFHYFRSRVRLYRICSQYNNTNRNNFVQDKFGQPVLHICICTIYPEKISWSALTLEH